MEKEGSICDDLIIIEVNSPTIDYDDIELQKFLKTIDMESLFDTLKAANVTYRSLPYITNGDLAEAIAHLGIRAEFRSKLFNWRKTELGINDDTFSESSKVQVWLNQNDAMSPSSSFISDKKDLKTLSIRLVLT